MEITVIGASKGTGSYVVTRAARDKHAVRGLSRSGSLSSVSGVKPIRGDALDQAVVRRAVAKADAVVVTIGAPARDTSGLRARATATIIDAMRRENVRRLIVQSSMGVDDSAPQLNWITKHIVVPLFLKGAFADHLEQEHLVRASGLDWTIVRPGYLKDKPGTGRYEVGFTDMDKNLTGSVTRADLADFIVRSLDDESTYRRAITISAVRS